MAKRKVSTPYPQRKKGNTDEEEVVRLSRKVHQLRGIISRQNGTAEQDDPDYRELPY